jgi:hypothetical protein
MQNFGGEIRARLMSGSRSAVPHFALWLFRDCDFGNAAQSKPKWLPSNQKLLHVSLALTNFVGRRFKILGKFTTKALQNVNS